MTQVENTHQNQLKVVQHLDRTLHTPLSMLGALDECVLEISWNEDVVRSYASSSGIDYFIPYDTFSGQFEVAGRVFEARYVILDSEEIR